MKNLKLERVALALLTLLVGLNILFTGVVVEAASNTVTLNGRSNISVSEAVLRLVNQERTRAGLSAVQYDYGIQTHVEQRAAEISVYFEHQKPDGRSPFADFNLGYMGENIQMNSVSSNVEEQALKIMNSFKASPSHWANIMHPDWRFMAVGTWYGGTLSKGGQISNRVHVAQWFSNVSSGQGLTGGFSSRTVTMPYGVQLSASVSGNQVQIAQVSNTYGNLGGWSYRLNLGASSFSYVSSNPAIVAVDAYGNLTPMANGSAQISVIGNGGSVLLTINVNASGGNVQ